MATRAETVDHLRDLLAPLPLTARKMFGEYALYLDGVVVALVCDDTLWIKPLPGARALLPDCDLAPPFPGGSLYMNVAEALDDPDTVRAALRSVARERPPPKPRKKKKAE
ncbi:TfoX/Sxy family protein [Neotabrizicola sp. VNH66]|uniref:TfoX/Sxy family protein n=1 Tax=Neotabrizicola sp. VNH66 TaxID=3400918 RepID=UPI003C019555